MLYTYPDIKVVHLEMTTRCNAACPMCPRNMQGSGVNPNMPVAELSLSDIKTIFQPDFVGRLKRMYMCGNYGDALVAKDTLETFQYFREHNAKMNLLLVTNGSGRTPDWWKALAKTVDQVTFSIDGLEDTNHLYRRQTDWKKIMAATTAFIEAGGKANWEFLVFKHNEHQVEEARALSQKMGFQKFTHKATDRFWSAGRVVESAEVLDAAGKVEYLLEAPSPENRNKAVAAIDQATQGQKDYQSYLEQTEIDCKVMKDQQIYVNAEGVTLPCCWTGKLYERHQPPGKSRLWQLINKLPLGKESLNAKTQGLRSIIDGPFFQTIVPESWQKGPQRFTVCARTCGKLDVIKSIWRQA